MKKLLAIAAASTVLISAPAFAQSTDSQDLAISATVAPECSIANPNDVSLNISINQNAGTGALLMTQNANNSQNIWTSCNYAAQIKIDGAPLMNAAGASVAANDAANFTNKLNYVLTFEPPAAGGPFSKLTLNTRVGNTTSQTPAGAFHQNAKLGVTIPSDSANNPLRPVAGTYTSTAVITLGAI